MDEFDEKMDVLVKNLMQMSMELEYLDDDEFSVELGAFRFMACALFAQGWTMPELTEHLQEEWAMSQQLEEEYRRTLN